MDILTDSRQVSRLEIVETGRRRRWSEAEKLRIVEESFSAPRLVSATARHHGVAKQLLFSWRKAYREGQLGGCQVDGFVPAQIVPENEPTTESAASAATGTLEIVTANGRRVIVDHGVDVAVLLRIITRAGDTALIPIPTGVRVWLATGHTDMRCGFPSLALRVQEVLKRDAMGGGLFCFRGKRGDLLKVIWHDGQGACLFTKKLERGRFIWPSVAGESVMISPAQLSYLLSGIDWRNPQETQRPTRVG
jgi:transposase